MIAILESAQAGLLAPRHWASNLIAGLVVGVVALPLAMAFAIASGVPPERGIYTAIVAGAVVSLFGGSRIQIAGPTGAFIVILAGVTATHGVEGLMLATLMAGAILVLLGVARFGGVIRFIPAPVITGFTTGIAVIIWVGQWKDFFGLPAPEGAHFHEKLWHLLLALPGLHIETTLLAAASLLLAIFGARIPGLQRVPGPLTAMVFATLVQTLHPLPGVATIGSAFGGIPRGLPSFSLPEIDADRMLLLLPSAFTIAMLGAIESLLSAVIADRMGGTRHDSNQELIGQGLANLAAPLFGGFAATGALARTATNFRNGANSPLAGVVHALVLVLILLVLAPLAAGIPLCALAAILFVVAWNMSELKHFLRMARTAPRADVVILLVTFGLTLFADLVIAVNIGVILAMMHFLRRMASAVEVLDTTPEGAPKDLRVYAIEGPFFFGAIESLDRIMHRSTTPPRSLIIRLGRVPFMDVTGLEALSETLRSLEQRGTRVILCEANRRVLRKLARSRIVRREDRPVRYYREFENALEALGGVPEAPVPATAAAAANA